MTNLEKLKYTGMIILLGLVIIIPIINLIAIIAIHNEKEKTNFNEIILALSFTVILVETIYFIMT